MNVYAIGYILAAVLVGASIFAAAHEEKWGVLAARAGAYLFMTTYIWAEVIYPAL